MRFSKRMATLKPSAIRATQKKIASKPGVISFAAGLPDPDLFPLKDLAAATDKLMAENGKGAFQYGMTKGYGPLIDTLVGRMKSKEGVDCTAANISITTGSQQGLALCGMMFLDEGDIVIAENPSYLGAINAWRPYSPEFIGVDTDDDGMIIEQLDKVLSENPKARMIYVIPNFQNPTGKAWSLERRKQFIKVVNKYDVIVVEDNPYGEIRFKGEPIPSLKSMDTMGKVVYLGSFSKVLSPGLRVAWVCADEEIAASVERLKEGLDLQCSQFSQMQIQAFMDNYDLDAHIAKIQAAYKVKCELMLDLMEKNLPASVKFTKPEGGMFVWVELPEGNSAEELVDAAIDAGVAYVPGEHFYANDGNKGTMRLNFTTVSEEQITEGIKILADVLKKNLK